MKIILLGRNGQVGWELQRALQPIGEVIALNREVENGQSGDITDYDAMHSLFESQQPDVVVNASAYTAVDQAEKDIDICELVNHMAVRHLAHLCKKHSCLLVHYSTDYVFNGSGKSPWKETDLASPINQYGISKRNGELAIERSGCQFLNFRTSWVYGVQGNNFIKTMLRLAKTNESLSIVSNQIGAPTGAALIADVTAHAIRHYIAQSDTQKTQLIGHYHLTASGQTSWYEYAKFIFATASKLGSELTIKNIYAVSTAQYPTLANRPLNSRLSTDKLQKTFNVCLPPWQLGVEHALQELIHD